MRRASWALTRFQKLTQHRENSKSVVIQYIALIRKYTRHIASILTAKGIFSADDDIFFISYEQLSELFVSVEGVDLRAHVKRNRKEYERCKALVEMSPDLFLGPKPIYRDTEEGEQLLLKGIAASPGVVTGIACVLDSPLQGSKLMPHGILVTKTTDPAWTPLFLKASGIAVQYGALLSHGAITAREFGLPAVLGVDSLLCHIKDGDKVVIDGSNGTIQILKE